MYTQTHTIIYIHIYIFIHICYIYICVHAHIFYIYMLNIYTQIHTQTHTHTHISAHVCCVLSRFSCVQLFSTPWTVAHQAPLSMGFSRQPYWSRMPVPVPGDPGNPGMEPRFPALKADSLLSEPPGKLLLLTVSKSLI